MISRKCSVLALVDLPEKERERTDIRLHRSIIIVKFSSIYIQIIEDIVIVINFLGNT